MNLEEYFSQRNYYKCIHKIHPGLGFDDVKWIGFLGHENSDYELTVSHVSLSRGSQTLKESNFQAAKIQKSISTKARYA
jgi:hypothetical protein